MTETTTQHGAPRTLLAFLREARAERRTTPGRAARRMNVMRWVALSMLVVIPMIAILGVFSGAKAFAAGGDDESMQYSFYKVASSTTAFFSKEDTDANAMAPTLLTNADAVAALPEPGGLLAAAGSLGLTLRRRRSAHR